MRSIDEVTSGLGLAKIWKSLKIAIHGGTCSDEVQQLLLHVFGAYNEQWLYDAQLYDEIFGNALLQIRDVVAKGRTPNLGLLEFEAAETVFAEYKEHSELSGYSMADGVDLAHFVRGMTDARRQGVAKWIMCRAATDINHFGFSRAMGAVLDVAINPVGVEEHNWACEHGLWTLGFKDATKAAKLKHVAEHCLRASMVAWERNENPQTGLEDLSLRLYGDALHGKAAYKSLGEVLGDEVVDRLLPVLPRRCIHPSNPDEISCESFRKLTREVLRNEWHNAIVGEDPTKVVETEHDAAVAQTYFAKGMVPVPLEADVTSFVQQEKLEAAGDDLRAVELEKLLSRKKLTLQELFSEDVRPTRRARAELFTWQQVGSCAQQQLEPLLAHFSIPTGVRVRFFLKKMGKCEHCSL